MTPIGAVPHRLSDVLRAGGLGDVEQAHVRFKEAVDQALRVRGSREFADRAASV